MTAWVSISRRKRKTSRCERSALQAPATADRLRFCGWNMWHRSSVATMLPSRVPDLGPASLISQKRPTSTARLRHSCPLLHPGRLVRSVAYPARTKPTAARSGDRTNRVRGRVGSYLGQGRKLFGSASFHLFLWAVGP
jgi:hypothetical protein